MSQFASTNGLVEVILYEDCHRGDTLGHVCAHDSDGHDSDGHKYTLVITSASFQVQTFAYELYGRDLVCSRILLFRRHSRIVLSSTPLR